MSGQKLRNSLFQFLIKQLKDQEFPIFVAATDSVIHIDSKFGIDEDNFPIVTPDDCTIGGVVHLVACIPKLLPDVKLFTFPQFRNQLLKVPRERLSLGDWFDFVLQEIDEMV